MNLEFQNVEGIILSGILHNKDFTRVALPHLKTEYFEKYENQIAFDLIKSHIEKYNTVPSIDAMSIELSEAKNVPESSFRETESLLAKISSEDANNAISKLSYDWLIEKAEAYCKYRSAYLGVMEAIDIIDGTNKKYNKDAIPELLQKSLSVQFNNDIGHDYIEDFESRFDFYHMKEAKVKTPLSVLNTITKGGIPYKTLNVIIAPTGVGKTHIMTYFSSRFLEDGLDVLYVTMEMSEERIAERVDSCLFDCPIDDLKKYHKDVFSKKIQALKSKTSGKLVIKEYPTGSINVNGLRSLLDELKVKKNFTPKILVLDYINLIGSTRYKGGGDNSYGVIKATAEELRGLAVERNLICLTASQTNRSGQGASDFDLTEVSDSHGLSMTADFMIGAISTEELEKLGQMRIKILKNRYGSKTPNSFIVGVDREKMTLFDIDVVEKAAEDTTPKFKPGTTATKATKPKSTGIII